jgi:hypothetical protein
VQVSVEEDGLYVGPEEGQTYTIFSHKIKD